MLLLKCKCLSFEQMPRLFTQNTDVFSHCWRCLNNFLNAWNEKLRLQRLVNNWLTYTTSMLQLKPDRRCVSVIEMREYIFFGGGIFLKKVCCSFEAAVVESFKSLPFCCIFCNSCICLHFFTFVHSQSFR